MRRLHLSGTSRALGLEAVPLLRLAAADKPR
jgi:hypothetical protein